MKKAILVSVRKAIDEKSKSNVLWLTMYELPRTFKSKQNGENLLWYPKKDDAVLVTCISQENSPNDYQTFLDVPEGSLLGVHFGVNDYTNKTFILRVDVLAKSNFTGEQLYVTKN